VEGFDNDDMYIMVEDEFYAVAQSFTQHLHHAEYIRKEAKLKNASAINNFERPTNNRAIMDEETKHTKESGGSPTLGPSLDNVESKRPQADLEEFTDTDVDREDDPWVGTSLHGLMTSPRTVRSLMGPHGIKSSTRAAAGYYAPSSVKERSKLPKPPLEDGGVVEHSVIFDNTISEDDDLEAAGEFQVAPSKATASSQLLLQCGELPAEAKIKNTIELTESDLAKPGRHLNLQKTEKISSHSKYSSPSRSTFGSKMKKILDGMDDLEDFTEIERSKERMQNQPRQSLSAQTPSKNRQGTDTQSKRSRLNEVPTFIL
jgi:hypothetical protein